MLFCFLTLIGILSERHKTENTINKRNNKLYLIKINLLFCFLCLKYITFNNLDILFFLIIMILSNYDIISHELEENWFIKILIYLVIDIFIKSIINFEYENFLIIQFIYSIPLFLIMYMIYILSHDYIGGADIKLYFIIIMKYGLIVSITSLFIASWITLIYYVFNKLVLDYDEREIAFVPFINVGLILTLILI